MVEKVQLDRLLEHHPGHVSRHHGHLSLKEEDNSNHEKKKEEDLDS